MQPSLTAVPAEVRGRRRAKYELVRRPAADGWDDDGSHASPCVTTNGERQCARCGMCGYAIKFDQQPIRLLISARATEYWHNPTRRRHVTEPSRTRRPPHNVTAAVLVTGRHVVAGNGPY
ncbi:hypothetical protein GCM10022255_116590 [Dactylosporangium darangshiense]|uniref:Transposase n=1 Tax=Dactylosporangium darangshiense TaxID=579108 RepID=A0ABP8DWB2_9ACTN